jgi:hypothetical protein
VAEAIDDPEMDDDPDPPADVDPANSEPPAIVVAPDAAEEDDDAEIPDPEPDWAPEDVEAPTAEKIDSVAPDWDPEDVDEPTAEKIDEDEPDCEPVPDDEPVPDSNAPIDSSSVRRDDPVSSSLREPFSRRRTTYPTTTMISLTGFPFLSARCRYTSPRSLTATPPPSDPMFLVTDPSKSTSDTVPPLPRAWSVWTGSVKTIASSAT